MLNNLAAPNLAIKEGPHDLEGSPDSPVCTAQRYRRIMADPYYGPAQQMLRSWDLMKLAGYVDNAKDRGPDYQISVLSTPIDKLVANLAQRGPAARYAVLVTTGSFSPLHSGHLDMMEAARRYLDLQGVPVVAGYLSPSNDAYVGQKYPGAERLTGMHRVQLCQHAVADSDWLMTDPWEALQADVNVNFTAVLQRLQLYLEQHLRGAGLDSPPVLDLYYVFGSDNAAFSLAFIHTGQCLCVDRGVPTPAHQQAFELAQQLRASHVHWVPNTCASQLYSSTRVRAGEAALLPAPVQSLMASWRSRPAQSARYLIRGDLTQACRSWNLPDAILEQFQARLGKCIEHAFAGQRMEPVLLPDYAAATPGLPPDDNLLSLDAWVAGRHRLRLSRLFGVGDGQIFSNQLVASPGAPPLAEQMAAIPAGAFHVVDDDVASGQTLRNLAALLAPRVRVTGVTALCQRAFHARFGDEEPYLAHDIVDARDFLLGTKNGGLVVTLPNQVICRVPYMFPYVNLCSRAKIPPLTALWLSRALWQLNLDLFYRAPQVRVADADEATRALFEYLGFSPATALWEVAQWHLEQHP